MINSGIAACRAVPCRVMSACYGRVPFRAVSSKSQPRVMPCHVTHFLPLVCAVSWRVITFEWPGPGWGPVRVGARSGLGPIWALMGPYGPLWVLLDRSWQVRTCPISDFW